jgi:23S rRNA pseudouridine2605 synthase
VNRLIRISYGPFQLGKLIEGAVDEVPRRVLKEQLGVFFEGETQAAKAKRKARAATEPEAQGAKPAIKPEPASPKIGKTTARKPAPHKATATPRPSHSGSPRAGASRADRRRNP